MILMNSVIVLRRSSYIIVIQSYNGITINCGLNNDIMKTISAATTIKEIALIDSISYCDIKILMTVELHYHAITCVLLLCWEIF